MDITHSSRLVEALRAAPLFDSLNDEDLSALVPFLTQASFDNGDLLIEEEAEGRNLLVVVEGQARSATIQADTQIRVLVLSWDSFESFGEANSRAAQRIMVNIARRVSDRVRSLNADTVTRLELEVRSQKERAMMGRLITYVILLLFGYNLTLQATMRLSTDPFWANVISFAIVTVFGVALVALARQAGYPWSEYGINLRRWRASLRESLWWTLAVAIVLTIGKWILVSTVPRYAGVPVLGPFEGTLSVWALTIYGLLAPVQEFIARGVLQSSFERFYAGRRGPLVANIVANALFSAAHVHLSAAFAAIVFLPGLLWGYLYSRNKTLLGVSVSHILLGWYAVFLLRFTYLAGI